MRNSKKVLSKSELAGALGVSRGRISQLVAVGLPVRPDSKIDLDKAAAWYQKNIKRSSARPELASPPTSVSVNSEKTLTEARRQLEWVRLERESLALAKLRGDLVDLGAVNAWVAGMITRAAGILDRIPAELGDRLAQISDPIACQKLLKAEIDRARHELAEYRS
jgi:transcriptional regulator with XRE-family HTH domain